MKIWALQVMFSRKSQVKGNLNTITETMTLKFLIVFLRAVSFYVQILAVPVRRSADDVIVLQGKKLFNDAKCSSCHRPVCKPVFVDFPEVSNQRIFPYTDLLLHDMGDGLYPDHRPDFDANGNEWRTAPLLWGIGLTQKVNGHNFYLHDGRARSLQEAILWHGGEAESAKILLRT